MRLVTISWVRGADQPTVKADLQAVMNAKTVPQARSAARRFADRWEPDYPKAACATISTSCRPRPAPGQALLVLRITRPAQTGQDHQRHRTALSRSQTANPPMGVFSDRTSMDRILFAVFNRESRNPGVSTPLLLTQAF
jgi:hypothetical protein